MKYAKIISILFVVGLVLTGVHFIDAQTAIGQRIQPLPVSSGPSVVFQRVLTDRSAQGAANVSNGVSSLIKVISIGGKKYLMEGTGYNLTAYSLTNPLSPSKSGEIDLSILPSGNSLNSCSSVGGSKRYASNIHTVDNSPLVLVTGFCPVENTKTSWLLKFNASSGGFDFLKMFPGINSNGYETMSANPGAYSKENSQQDALNFIFKAKDGKTYAIGDHYYVLGDGSSGISSYVYSVSESSPFISRVSELSWPSGSAPSAQDYQWAEAGGKTYVLIQRKSAMGTDFSQFHEEYNFTEVYDLSNPQNPVGLSLGRDNGKDYTKQNQFDYLTNEERAVAVPSTGRALIDPVSKRLYQINDVHYGAGYPIGGVFRNRLTLRAFNLSSLPAFSSAGKADLDEHVDADKEPFWSMEHGGWSYGLQRITGKDFFGSLTSFGDAVAFSWRPRDNFKRILTPAIGCSGESFDWGSVLVRNTDGSFGKINDNGELLKGINQLSNKTSYYYCSQVPTGSAIAQVDSKTLALYRATNLFTEVDKITLASAISGGGGGGYVVPPIIQPVGKPAINFQNLYNIFKKIFIRE